VTFNSPFSFITHLLRQWSHFASRQAPDVVYSALLQFIDATSFRLLEPLLHFSPNSVVKRVQMWIRSHRSGEMKAGVSHSKKLIILRVYYYRNDDPCNFDISYLVFNMKLHWSIMSHLTHHSVWPSSQALVVLWMVFSCLQKHNSEWMSVTHHYTTRVGLCINILTKSPRDSWRGTAFCPTLFHCNYFSRIAGYSYHFEMFRINHNISFLNNM